MRALLVITVLASSLLLAGCPAVLPVRTEIVTVNKPVPFIPPPPTVPKFESQVDKLTLDDANDPGKVGQAYKYDMTALRNLVKIYQMILDTYSAGAQNFDQVNKEIDQLFKGLPPAK